MAKRKRGVASHFWAREIHVKELLWLAQSQCYGIGRKKLIWGCQGSLLYRGLFWFIFWFYIFGVHCMANLIISILYFTQSCSLRFIYHQFVLMKKKLHCLVLLFQTYSQLHDKSSASANMFFSNSSLSHYDLESTIAICVNSIMNDANIWYLNVSVVRLQERNLLNVR